MQYYPECKGQGCFTVLTFSQPLRRLNCLLRQDLGLFLPFGLLWDELLWDSGLKSELLSVSRLQLDSELLEDWGVESSELLLLFLRRLSSPRPAEHTSTITNTAWRHTFESRHEISKFLTSVALDEPLQSPFKLRYSKWCSVSSLTLI